MTTRMFCGPYKHEFNPDHHQVRSERMAPGSSRPRRAWEKTTQESHGLTRHGVTVEVVSDGLLQFMVRRGFLEALVQIMLQVLIQLASCHRRHKQENRWLKMTRLGFSLLEVTTTFDSHKKKFILQPQQSLMLCAKLWIVHLPLSLRGIAGWKLSLPSESGLAKTKTVSTTATAVNQDSHRYAIWTSDAH